MEGQNTQFISNNWTRQYSTVSGLEDNMAKDQGNRFEQDYKLTRPNGCRKTLL